MSERHNQARDIYRKTMKSMKYVLTIYTPEKKKKKNKTWNPQMKVRKINHLFKEWLSGSMLVLEGSSWCFFPTAVKHMLLYAGYHFFKVCGKFLPTSSKLVRGDDFKGKYPTS